MSSLSFIIVITIILATLLLSSTSSITTIPIKIFAHAQSTPNILDLNCGIHDDVLIDPSLTIRIRANETVGSQHHPCEYLEISNKQVHKIDFMSEWWIEDGGLIFTLNQLVLRNNKVQQIDVHARNMNFTSIIVMSAPPPFGSSVLRHPSILVENNELAYVADDEINAGFHLLSIHGPQPELIEHSNYSFSFSSIIVRNNNFRLNPNLINPANTFQDPHSYFAAFSIQNVRTSDELIVVENKVETTFIGFRIVSNASTGIVNISNNRILSEDKRLNMANAKGAVEYNVDKNLIFIYVDDPAEDDEGQIIFENAANGNKKRLSFYLMNNNATRIASLNFPGDQAVCEVRGEIEFGEEFIIENNIFHFDGNRQPAIQPIQGEVATRLLSMWKNGLNFKRVLLTKNTFFIQTFATINALRLYFSGEGTRACGSGENDFLEISRNDFWISSKSKAAVEMDWSQIVNKDERSSTLKTSVTVVGISAKLLKRCRLMNVSLNNFRRIESYRIYGPRDSSADEIMMTANPLASIYAFDIGNQFEIDTIIFSNNNVSLNLEANDKYISAIHTVAITQFDYNTILFSTLKRLILNNNNISLVSSSSSNSDNSKVRVNSFNNFIGSADLPQLETLQIIGNTVDVRRLVIFPCRICSNKGLLFTFELIKAVRPEASAVVGLIDRGQNPSRALAAFITSRKATAADEVLISVQKNVFIAALQSEAGNLETVLFLSADEEKLNLNSSSKKKSVIFTDNKLELVDSFPSPLSSDNTEYFPLSLSILLSVASASCTNIQAINNQQIFHGSSSSSSILGMAMSFFLELSTTSGANSNNNNNNEQTIIQKVFEFRQNRIIRRGENNNNNNNIPQSSSFYQQLVGYRFLQGAPIAIWKMTSSADGSPTATVIQSFLTIGMNNSNEEMVTAMPQNQQQHQLLVSNNHVDMNNATHQTTDNIFVFFNRTNSNLFRNISILNNDVHFSHNKAQTCSLVSGLATGGGSSVEVKIENNQIDFAKCEKTSSMLNATTIGGGDVSLRTNTMSCGNSWRCLFASINISQQTASSSLTLNANRISINKPSECDDEQRYFNLHQRTVAAALPSSSSLLTLDVSSETFESGCNEIHYQNDESRFLNVSAWNSSSTPSTITINDLNCQVLSKCSEDEDHRRMSDTKSSSLLPDDTNNPLLSSAAIVVVSDTVSAALTTNDVVQSVSMGAIAIGAAATPALAFNVARSQAVMNYAQNALKGDCRGLLPATKTSGEEDSENDNPLGAADSPTRMQIGDSVAAAFVGAVIGNFILFCDLIILNQGIGHLVTKIIIAKYFSIPSNMKLAIMFSNKKKKEFEQQENRWKDFKYVFANSFVSLSLFYLVALLLSPTLTSAVVVVAGVSNDIVPVGMKILCLILAFIISGVGVYFIVWSTFIRKPRREEYRINQEEANARNKKKELGAGDLFKSLCKPDGEWKIPINKRTEKENDEFQISNPCYESYRKNHWFAVVEIITSILICLPPLFAQLGSSGKSSCIIQGSLLFFILLAYTILLIWKNPKKLRIMRVLAPTMAVQQLITVGMTLIAVVIRKENEDNGYVNSQQKSNNNGAQEESWLWKAIFVPLGFSVFLGFFAAATSIFPLLLFVKKLRARIQKQQQERETLMKKQSFSDGRYSSRNNSSHHNNDNDDDREMRELTGSSRRREEDHMMRRSSKQHHDDERRSRGIQDRHGSSDRRSSRDRNSYNRDNRERDTHHRSNRNRSPNNYYRDRNHRRDSKERGEDRRVSTTSDSNGRHRESSEDHHRRHHDHRNDSSLRRNSSSSFRRMTPDSDRQKRHHSSSSSSFRRHSSSREIQDDRKQQQRNNHHQQHHHYRHSSSSDLHDRRRPSAKAEEDPPNQRPLIRKSSSGSHSHHDRRQHSLSSIRHDELL